MKRFLTAISLVLAAFLATVAIAQPAKPIDGDMVKLQIDKLWKIAYLANAPVAEAQQIATGLESPAISPDGSNVLIFKRGNIGEPHHMLQWSADAPEVSEILTDTELSSYVTWQSDQAFSVREHSAPFLKSGADRHFDIAQKAPVMKQRKLHKDAKLVAYDADDVIILENAANQTLQAISDIRADRYFAPIVSPDNRFVAFSGLTTGIHVFDVEQNAVVFIGSHGTSPSFSPDGRYLVYANTRDNGHEITSGELVLVDLNAHTYRNISNPNHEIRVRASLSRDAAYISYQTDDNRIFRAKLVP